MAWTRAQPATISGRWSCTRCYTVNAVAAQFCSDCGLAHRFAPVALAAPAIEPAGRRLLAVPFMLFGVVAVVLMGLQLIR